MRPSTPEAYQLFHQGTLALANVEANGMRVDLDYLDGAIKQANRTIKELEQKLQADEIFKQWRRHYGTRTKLGSGEQLAHVLFTIMGLPCRERTATGRPSAAESNLLDIDLDFVREWRRLAKFTKSKGTFLEGIRNFTTSDGLIHPNFNLNLVASYRSSSDNPNFQNFPSRNEEMAKLVRSAFIPRKNHHLVESDFKGIEVGVACCYTKDKNLIRDYTEGDMHRDMAMECYQLPMEEVGKQIRYCGKNMFVFPEFYGDYYASCARHLWEAIERMSLKTVSGTPLYEHLASVGIEELGDCDPNESPREGSFEEHIRAVEDCFWNERYRTYNDWKRETWQEYQNRGWSQLYTGFVVTQSKESPVMNRKQVINYRIQGSAFHCLLWCLIEMDKWLKKNRMRSKIVSQIHDSLIGDVHKDELADYLWKINDLMTVQLAKVWKWINVPLGVEMEICALNGTWFDKKKVDL